MFGWLKKQTTVEPMPTGTAYCGAFASRPDTARPTPHDLTIRQYANVTGRDTTESLAERMLYEVYTPEAVSGGVSIGAGGGAAYVLGDDDLNVARHYLEQATASITREQFEGLILDMVAGNPAWDSDDIVALGDRLARLGWMQRRG